MVIDENGCVSPSVSSRGKKITEALITTSCGNVAVTSDVLPICEVWVFRERSGSGLKAKRLFSFMFDDFFVTCYYKYINGILVL